MPRMVDDNDDDGSELAVSKEGNEGGDEGNDEKLKKGPWTAFEDEMLREYVMKHGEGNWNSVQKNSGLARCGKSCRLRWANHLRPNLKKGAFSKEEEEIIVHLHAKLGNKWARMAAQLHGRTDNEIKNFWNTRMKRRQRAGLPLYPPEVQYEANSHNQYFAQPYSSSSLSFSSFLSPSYSQELNKKLSHSSLTNSQQNEPNHSCYTNPHSQFRFTNDNIGFSSNTSLSLSTISSHGQPLFDQHFAANKSCDYYSSTFMAGSLQESLALVQGSNTEVSSSQSPPGSTTPASSNNSGVYCLMGASSVANGREIASLSPQGNNGLLEDPVAEAQSVSHNDMSKSEDSVLAEKLTCKRKIMAPRESSEEDNTLHVETIMKNNDDNTKKKQRIDSSSSQFSTGKKLITEDSLDGMNSTDDDLFTLLNNFPSDMPMPGWYRHGERHSLELESQKDASSGHIDQEFAWTLGTFWSNMPNIC